MSAYIRTAVDGIKGILGFGSTDAVKFDGTGILAGSYAPGSVTPAALSQKLTLGTPIASTSGTSIDITGIPSWATKIVLSFYRVGTSALSPWLLQLGDSGGIEVSDYAGGAGDIGGDYTNTTGLALIRAPVGGRTYSGSVLLTRHNSASTSWVSFGILADPTGQPSSSGGTKTLSAPLDRIRLTTAGGTDTFTGGSINILYE